MDSRFFSILTNGFFWNNSSHHLETMNYQLDYVIQWHNLRQVDLGWKKSFDVYIHPSNIVNVSPAV